MVVVVVRHLDLMLHKVVGLLLHKVNGLVLLVVVVVVLLLLLMQEEVWLRPRRRLLKDWGELHPRIRPSLTLYTGAQ